MSYILDALRKSDQQRQRGSSPTLLTAHGAPTASGRPTYLLYSTLAALVLVIGVTIGALRPWEHEAPAPPAAAAIRPPLAPPVAVASREVVTVRPDSETTRQVEPPPPAARAAPLAQSPSAAIHPVTPPPAPASAQLAATPSNITPAPTLPVPTPAVLPKNAVPATVVTAPPLPLTPQQLLGTGPNGTLRETPTVAYSELPFQIQQEIPRLTIAVHAYSREPKNRLVTIDSRLLHEGDEAAPGLKIEQITPDGMIFSYKGLRFRRSVQEIVNNR